MVLFRLSLDLIAKPGPFTDLTMYDVKVRVLGDFALVQGRASYITTHDGMEREARYTDTDARPRRRVEVHRRRCRRHE